MSAKTDSKESPGFSNIQFNWESPGSLTFCLTGVLLRSAFTQRQTTKQLYIWQKIYREIPFKWQFPCWISNVICLTGVWHSNWIEICSFPPTMVHLPPKSRTHSGKFYLDNIFFWEGAEICCLLSAFWFGQCLCLSSLSTEHQHTGRKRMWLGHLNFWPCLSSFQFRSTGIDDLGRLSAAGFPASGGTDCVCW